MASTLTGGERFSQLLEIASSLFSRQGYLGTSLTQIADALGIKKASLYYYIHSKEELLELVYAKVASELHDPIQRIDRDLSPCQQLWTLIQNHVAFHVRHGDFVRTIWRERHVLPAEVYDRIRSAEVGYESTVYRLLAAAQSDGCVDDYDTDLLRDSLLGMLTTVYRWPASGPDEERIRLVSAHIFRLVLSGRTTCPVHATRHASHATA